MNRFRKLCRAVTMPLVVGLLLAWTPLGAVQAGLVGTDRVLEQSTAAADRARVLDFMARDDVRQQFESLGVDPAEATARVQALSDDELRQIAGRLDALPAGEGSTIGIIVGAAVVIFLVLLLTDLLGLTNVYPFVRSAR
ncbi:MAG: PA2779 family protein [Minwuiales bacterium]|nr:PA2779 family protein [Minwuiales bacterium]